MRIFAPIMADMKTNTNDRMEPESKFESIPGGFAYCMDGQCKQAATCLRHLASQQLTPERKVFSIVNPACTTPQEDSCPFFKEVQTVRYALGITRLLDDLPHNKAVAARQYINAGFSKGTIYRIRKKERLITPEEQEFIRRVFVRIGIEAEPVFDQYVEQYAW